jgi:hypothetical protein
MPNEARDGTAAAAGADDGGDGGPRALYHTNILPLLGAITTPDDVGLVTIFQPLGSLDAVVNDPSVPLSPAQRAWRAHRRHRRPLCPVD